MALALITTALAVFSWVAPCNAHINLESPPPRGGDGQKEDPCGGAAPGERTEVTGGMPLKVTWSDGVPHPGWYVISLDPTGDDFDGDGDGTGDFPPQSVDTAGMYKNGDGSLVLMDNIDPVDYGGNRTPGEHMAEIMIPNEPCDDCTLQLIEVMDDMAHAPSAQNAHGHVYFRCADIKIVAGSGGPGEGTGGMSGEGEPEGGAGGTAPMMSASASGGAGGSVPSMSSSPAPTATQISMGGSGNGGGGNASGGSGPVSPGPEMRPAPMPMPAPTPAAPGPTTTPTTMNTTPATTPASPASASSGGVSGPPAAASSTAPTSDDSDSGDDGGCTLGGGTHSASSAWGYLTALAGLTLLRRRRQS